MSLELALFSTRPALIEAAVRGGVGAVIVDWERIGKQARQRGADTLISADTFGDLEVVRRACRVPVICRLDGPGPWTEEEIERAIAAGADEVLLPMVRHESEVEPALRVAAGRAGVGILIETVDALERVGTLAALGVSRVYVGLNDLAIERGSPSLFTALTDGTLDAIRAEVSGVPFGFGGMTLPDAGSPVPARLLLGELARLEADFTFLRRSFWRDVEGMDPAAAVQQIRAAAHAAAARSEEAVAADRTELLEVLSGMALTA
jgi:2-methylisocitrate lyase-like PEP mutase family enzyme